MARDDLPPATSASQLVSYAMCPRRYFLTYVAGATPEHRSTSLVLGSAVHGAAGWFFSERLEGREPTMEDAESVLRADLCAEIVEQDIRWKETTPEELEADSLRYLRAYLTAHASLPVVGVEQAFQVPLVDPATGEVLGRPLKGFFDFVLEDRVVELKTAAKSWSEFELARQLQIGAYNFATTSSSTDESIVEVHVIVKLKREPRVETFVVSRSQSDLRWWLRAAAEIEAAIAARHFPPSPSPYLCRDCEFEGACRKLGLEDRPLIRPSLPVLRTAADAVSPSF